jgi:hypothetical protein
MDMREWIVSGSGQFITIVYLTEVLNKLVAFP